MPYGSRMNLRNRFISLSGQPRMSRRSSVNCSLIDSLSRMRMTASSPCTLGMIDTRKSIVLPRTRSLKRPSCGTRFSAMSSSAMTLMREMIVLWCRLSIGSIACCSTPSMRYFTCTASSCVSMWMSEARRWSAVKTIESTSRMTGLASDVSLSTVRFSSPALVLAEDLHLEAFGGFLEHALRALALLQDDWIADGVPTHTRIGVFSWTPTSSIVCRSLGSDTTIEQRLPVAAVRHEAVAQHQVGRNAAEQRVVGVEVLEVDELELVALGQQARLDLFGGVIDRRRARGSA